MMQGYYRTAKAVTQLNTIVLQNLEARLLPEPQHAPRRLNERFRVRGELLEIVDEDLFGREPTSLLESFLLMMQHPELRGMTAPTLRALWRARGRPDAEFPRPPRGRLAFFLLPPHPRRTARGVRRPDPYGTPGRHPPEVARRGAEVQREPL